MMVARSDVAEDPMEFDVLSSKLKMYTSGPYKRIPLCLWSEISEIGSHLSKHMFLCAHDICLHTCDMCKYIYII